MAVDAGEVESRADDFFGPPLNRCARNFAPRTVARFCSQGKLIADPVGHLRWRVAGAGHGRAPLQGSGEASARFPTPAGGPPPRLPATPDRSNAGRDNGVGPGPGGPGLRVAGTGGCWGLRDRVSLDQPTVGREVAVKQIRAEYEQARVRPPLRGRGPARRPAGHPHIVRCTTPGASQTAYTVIRLLRGGSLRVRSSGGRGTSSPLYACSDSGFGADHRPPGA